MRFYEFSYLIEGYPQAQTAFIQQSGGDTAGVQKTIADFKQLVTRNQIKDVNQKNIDWWMKQGWDKFSQFVNQAAAISSKSQVEKKKLPGQSINLVDNANWFIVIPIDKESSCFHGKDSNWCTTKVHHAYFEDYFYDSEVTLIYCFNKSTGGMWAIAAHKDTDQMEMFDQRDRKLTAEQFTSQTGLDPEKLRSMAMGDVHQPKIQNSRDKWKASIALTDKLLNEFAGGTRGGTRSPEIEKELIYNKSGRMCAVYINKIGTIESKDFPKSIQIAAINFCRDDDFEYTIPHLIKHPVPAVQLAAVQKEEYAIQWVFNSEVTPGSAVQVAAFESIGSAAVSIMVRSKIKLSDNLQIAMFNSKSYSVADIIKLNGIPSEIVQKYIVGKDSNQIRKLIAAGIKPSEEIQLVAVEKDPYVLKSLFELGITPSEVVQLTAVAESGGLLNYIIDDGIKPSDAVQLAAIENWPFIIRSIVEAGIKPSEEAQITAVRKTGVAIYIIKNAGITPSEAVEKEAEETEEREAAENNSK